MSKGQEHENDDNEDLPENEPDVMALLLKMQQQLLFLERKIDALINQSAGGRSSERSYERSEGRERGGYEKPYRSYGGEKRSYGGGGNRSYGGGEGRSYGGGEKRSYGGGEKRSYGGGEKRSYGGGEKRSYGGGEKRSYGGGKPGFDKKKKTFGRDR